MNFCVPLDSVGPDEATFVGGKARSLLRLAAAGLPVPRALVLTSELFRALRAGGPTLPAAIKDDETLAAAIDAASALLAAAWPDGLATELYKALARLDEAPDARFSVRSSATFEDRPDAAGPGVFLSRTDVAAAEVLPAVSAVLAAAISPAAVAYAARLGLPPNELAMAVLVHPFTRGDAVGTAAFDPAAQDAPVVEIAGDAATQLSDTARATIIAAARDLTARAGASELEWVATGDRALFLQLRPYRAPVRAPWRCAAQLSDGTWRWDAAHNPLPLSPAQAGLVALVDARCHTAFRQRVIGGYLFFAPGSAPPVPSTDAATALKALLRDSGKRLAAQVPALEDALETFLAICDPLFGVVQPAARAARVALEDFLHAHHHPVPVTELLRGVPSLTAERARRAEVIATAENAQERAAAEAAYLDLFGDEAPVWDVATPTCAEDAGAFRHLAARAETPASAPSGAPGEALDAALPIEARAEGRRRLAAARNAAAAAEDDDALYARAQTVVRRALLREGRRLQVANVLARPEDIFWLPLEAVRRDARGEERLSAAGVTHACANARQAHAEALAAPPPLTGALMDPSARTGTLRGRPASAGRAIGAVHLHEPGAVKAVPAGAVLIARTLLPTELPLLSPAALVVETGGVLGHVAAQARERALPAVVDAAGACSAFREGDRVLVDGDAGLVVRLGD
jgi:phosphohistidine swiveling domain-containing protein